jgi:hypothetical protein
MIPVLIAPALIVALVFGLLAWRVMRDRAQERALAVRADVQSAVNRGARWRVIAGGAGGARIRVSSGPGRAHHPHRL